MDIKVEIKQESGFQDICSQREGETFSKDHAKKVKSETEEKVWHSNLHLLDQRELFSEHPVMKFNLSSNSEVESNIEIKEEQWWLKGIVTETSSIYDDIKDGKTEDLSSTKSPRLDKVGVSSYTSDLLSNEDLENNARFSVRKDNSECESARKCQSQEAYVTNISSRETPDEKIVSITSCLEHSNLLEQSNTNKEDRNKMDLRSFLSNENRKVYKCDICEMSFKYCFGLKCHRLNHENKAKNKCDVCQKDFDNLKRLKRHKLIHESIKRHKCNICEKAFNDLSSLKRHILIHEGLKPHKCNICNRGFTQLSTLKTHKYIHEGVKPHKCNICHKTFTQMQDLKTHKYIHEGIKPHQCNTCHKAFTRLQDMKTHRLIHEGIKSHKCNIRHKAFTQLQHLKTHQVIHQGIKPHKCYVCGKSFTRLEHLKRHQVIHQGIKPHKCYVCGKSFTRLEHLKRHKLIHEGIKSQ